MGYAYNKTSPVTPLTNQLYTGGLGMDVVTFYDLIPYDLIIDFNSIRSKWPIFAPQVTISDRCPTIPLIHIPVYLILSLILFQKGASHAEFYPVFLFYYESSHP